MSYRSLGDIATVPVTKTAEVWAPEGFKYLQVNEAGQPRPEYAGILASGSIPGLGWTQQQVSMGHLAFNEQVPFGAVNFLSAGKIWPGKFVLYAASYLGAPDAFLTPVDPADLLKWKGQPGIWVMAMPNNGPMTKAGWSAYLGGGNVVPVPPKPQPVPPGPGPGPQPVPPTPSNNIPPAPPAENLSLADRIRALTPGQRIFGVVVLGTLAYATGKYVYDEVTEGRSPRRDRKYGVPDPVPFPGGSSSHSSGGGAFGYQEPKRFGPAPSGPVDRIEASLRKLGLSKSATWADVKRAFRRFASENHPDRFPSSRKADAERNFKDVSEAYNFLNSVGFGQSYARNAGSVRMPPIWARTGNRYNRRWNVA